jgi:hypothetical protein
VITRNMAEVYLEVLECAHVNDGCLHDYEILLKWVLETALNLADSVIHAVCIRLKCACRNALPH